MTEAGVQVQIIISQLSHFSMIFGSQHQPVVLQSTDIPIRNTFI